MPGPGDEGVGVQLDVGVAGHGADAAGGAPSGPRGGAGADAPGPDIAVGAAAVDGAAVWGGGEARDALAVRRMGGEGVRGAQSAVSGLGLPCIARRRRWRGQRASGNARSG